MTFDPTLLSALLIGLMGSTHCLGMCGGIVSALTFGLDRPARQHAGRLLVYQLAYNGGRITSYAVAGAIAGAAGVPLIAIADPDIAGRAVQWISAAFMIALGLYLAGWWPGLQAIEKLGSRLWVRIEPLGRRLLPVNHPIKALVFGTLWGWLPCGLVYSALVWSLVSGSAADGALRMSMFGIGTLPMMLAAGVVANRLGQFTRNPWVRRTAGLIVLSFGLFLLFGPAGHHHASAPASSTTRYSDH